MKGWFLSGKKDCPVTIEPDQWARLCEYWTKPETEEKAQRMANARKQVKRISNVGRAGKAGKEAQLVCTPRFFPLHIYDILLRDRGGSQLTCDAWFSAVNLTQVQNLGKF